MFPRTDYGVTDSAYLPTTESEIVRFEWKMFRQNRLRGAFRTVQPLAFSNRQLSVGRIRPYFSSSALFNAVTIAPSKAKSATLFQWSELFCKSVTERHKPQRNANKKRSPPDPHPLKVWRATFTPKQCARRRFKTPPHYAETRPYIESRSLIHFQDSPDPKTISK